MRLRARHYFQASVKIKVDVNDNMLTPGQTIPQQSSGVIFVLLQHAMCLEIELKGHNTQHIGHMGQNLKTQKDYRDTTDQAN